MSSCTPSAARDAVADTLPHQILRIDIVVPKAGRCPSAAPAASMSRPENTAAVSTPRGAGKRNVEGPVTITARAPHRSMSPLMRGGNPARSGAAVCVAPHDQLATGPVVAGSGYSGDAGLRLGDHGAAGRPGHLGAAVA